MRWEKYPRNDTYEVSELGDVVHVVEEYQLLPLVAPERTRVVLQRHMVHGRAYISVYDPNWKNKTGVRQCPLDEMVMEAFVGLKPVGMKIIHFNGGNEDCRVVNLGYVMCKHAIDSPSKPNFKRKMLKGFENLYKRKDYFALKAQLLCEICGEKESACLAFHHIDPEEKEGNVSQLQGKRLLDEIKKCRVLCLNCHTKVHNGIVGFV